MDTLKVKDLMSPFDEKYVFEAKTEACDAVDEMTDKDLETAFVFDGKELLGQMSMVDLMKCRDRSQKLSDVARPIKTFQQADSVAFALSEMKNSGEYFAIVMNSGNPAGILVSDEVLLKLI